MPEKNDISLIGRFGNAGYEAVADGLMALPWHRLWFCRRSATVEDKHRYQSAGHRPRGS